MFTVRVTAEFDKRMKKICSHQEQEKIGSFKKRLEHDAYLGDTVGPFWVREMRLDGKRVYFLVDEPLVLLIAFSTKNNQQEVIDTIRSDLVDWKLILKQLNV